MTIFKDKGAAIEEFNSYLGNVAAYLGRREISPTKAWASLMSSEQEVIRKIKVPLEPVEVYSVVPPSPDEILALGDTPYVVEPGYDMPANFFGAGWGTIKLSTRPVIEVKSIQFVFPAPLQTAYTIPPNWVFPDLKSGIVQFIPAPTVSGVPAGAISMHLMSMGMDVPQMIRIRYSAGLQSSSPYLAEIQDLIMRLAVLRQVKFAPQSGSISADGLSRSMSADVDKFQAAIDEELEGLHQSILGPVWGVL